MESPLIATGSGYQNDRTFESYETIIEPLPTRPSRIFPAATGAGTTYESHSVKLAWRPTDYPSPRRGRGLYILLEHGGGRRVIALPTFWSHGAVDLEAIILAMDEKTQYAMLYTIARMVEDAAHYAARDTRAEWSQAFCDGRIRKSRPKQGRRYVTIEPKAAPAPAAT